MREPTAQGRTFALSVAVALWLGAALFQAVVVAPALFAALPTRALAGEVVGRLLPVLFVLGVVLGVLVAVGELRPPHARFWLFRAVAAVTLAVAAGIAQFGIAPRIGRLRESAGVPIDSLPAQDMLRVDFGRLHMLSVFWLGIAMLAAVAILTLAWLGLRHSTAAASGKDSASENQSNGEPSNVRAV